MNYVLVYLILESNIDKNNNLNEENNKIDDIWIQDKKEDNEEKEAAAAKIEFSTNLILVYCISISIIIIFFWCRYILFLYIIKLIKLSKLKLM